MEFFIIVSIPSDGYDLETPISLAPGAQTAKFLSQPHELIHGNLPVSSTVFVEVVSGEDGVIGTVLKLSEAGLTTFPLVVAP